jgi:hypothetical protein
MRPRILVCPGDAVELRAENARLRESAGRLRMLAEDKDAKTVDLEERIVRLERLVSHTRIASRSTPVPQPATTSPRCSSCPSVRVARSNRGKFTFGWAADLAGRLGWRFAVFSEPESAVLANVRFLSGYRRVRQPPAKHYPTLRRQ